MNEQDYKYLITTYQQKFFEVFSQLIVAESKNRQLNDTVELLNAKINEQQVEIEKLSSKSKRVSKPGDDF